VTRHPLAGLTSTGHEEIGAVDETTDELERILDDDAERTARRVVRRHKFGRLSDRRIITLLRPHADASGRAVQDRQLVELWFNAFARHVERLRRPNAAG
jgi:hypothetical protein